MSKEAMKLALSALEYWDLHGKLHQPTEEAIAAMREALAEQSEQQKSVRFKCTVIDDEHPGGVPLERWGQQTAQRTWLGLTDKDYLELHLEMGPTYFYQDYGRAIEAKLKEKNT